MNVRNGLITLAIALIIVLFGAGVLVIVDYMSTFHPRIGAWLLVFVLVTLTFLIGAYT